MAVSSLGVRLTVRKRWGFPVLYALGCVFVTSAAPFVSMARLDGIVSGVAGFVCSHGMYVKIEVVRSANNTPHASQRCEP